MAAGSNFALKTAAKSLPIESWLLACRNSSSTYPTVPSPTPYEATTYLLVTIRHTGIAECVDLPSSSKVDDFRVIWKNLCVYRPMQFPLREQQSLWCYLVPFTYITDFVQKTAVPPILLLAKSWDVPLRLSRRCWGSKDRRQ